MLGIALLMLTEYFLLVQPHLLHYVYTILTFPVASPRACHSDYFHFAHSPYLFPVVAIS